MKSIKTKMVVVICLLVTISLAVVGGTVSVLMYKSSMASLEKTMSETAQVTAELVYEYLETYKAVANDLGMVEKLSDEGIPLKEKQAIFDERINQYGFLAGNIADTKGQGVLYDVDISDRDYFKKGLQGEASISNVLLSKSLNQYTFIVAAPLWEGGVKDSTVKGIVYFNVDVKELSDITNKVAIGETGGAYMLDKDNYTIAHKNLDLVLNRDNTIEGLKEDEGLAELAVLEKEMTEGKTGFGTYQYDGGVTKILAYAPIDTGQGWSVAVNAELKEFLKSTYTAITITIVLTAAAILIGIFIAIALAQSITRPIIKIKEAAVEMAKGNFEIVIDHNSKDETGSLADSMRQMIDTTKSIILDTERGLKEVANGNFNIAPKVEYIGVYKGIELALIEIITGLSNMVYQIQVATDQVSSGSEQVSSGAQALAQGATEQASSVQQLSASINEVSGQIENNAEHAETASHLAKSATQGLELSNTKMQDMIVAMSEINHSSAEIGKIIKAIEDIAFQTNILALNAAVEAARAGEAGKGFAVVADEVRNLATKSSQAAQQTNVLIEGSVKSVENGVKIADETAQSLATVVTEAESMTELIAKISEASLGQSHSLSQISLGVEQISAVVHTNSATSEESAAASEELNSQASMMKDLVSKFVILDVKGIS